MALGQIAIEKAKEIIAEQIDTYSDTMADAFVQQDGELSVSLTLKFRAVGEKIRMDYGISFIQDRVRDGDTMIIDEKQQSLPFPDIE